eukprot:scaffold26185_cov62-Phaeocystis_antarctica.AAC.9
MSRVIWHLALQVGSQASDRIARRRVREPHNWVVRIGEPRETAKAVELVDLEARYAPVQLHVAWAEKPGERGRALLGRRQHVAQGHIVADLQPGRSRLHPRLAHPELVHVFGMLTCKLPAPIFLVGIAGGRSDARA